MSGSKGVYKTRKKDGSPTYRTSITYKNKHISLGSFSQLQKARLAYDTARRILDLAETDVDSFKGDLGLTHDKWVILHNFRDNGYYFKTPIYLKKQYFIYYLNPHRQLYFDADDLFYYSSHPIHTRGGYLFVNDYGMQVNILNRYGIQNHTVEGRDYHFVDGDANNLRYDNIQVHNPYHGVTFEKKEMTRTFKARINLNGYYIVGRYENLDTAAIAYNKAVDYVTRQGLTSKQFEKNYITHMDGQTYSEIYEGVKLSKNLLSLTRDPSITIN